jgi:hypothetical protein
MPRGILKLAAEIPVTAGRTALTLLLLATIFPVHAQFATGGSGAYKNNILWFDWGNAGASIPQAGTSVSNDITFAGATLRVTCTISNISGAGPNPDLAIYRPGGYFEDGLDNLYNVLSGGINTMDIGLANRTDAQSATFTYACSATLDGKPYPLDGLVFSDAETTNEDEFIRAILPAGQTMRVIERYRADQCATGYNVNATGPTYTFTTSSPYSCWDIGDGTNSMGVYFIDNVSNLSTISATITVSSMGGKQAVAVGVSTHVADFGDAPSSYGVAAHTPQFSWSGGTLSSGNTDIFDSGFSLAAVTQPVNARLGALVDSEPQSQHSSSASTDDSDNIDDEDAVDVSALAPLLRGYAGQAYSVQVSCAGTSPINGWIDFDRNGSFDADERSDAAVCNGASATLNWTINSDVLAGRSYMRIRTALDAGDISLPTGLAPSGEVEDYAITIADARLRVAKVTTAGVAGPFEFSTTNTLSQPTALTTVVAGTAAVGGALSIISLGTDIVVTETAFPAAWELSAISCVNAAGAAPVVVYDLPSRSATLSAGSIAEDADITCTFTSRTRPLPFSTCPSEAFVTRDDKLYSLNLLSGVMTALGTSAPLSGNSVNAVGFREADGYIWGYYNNGDGSGFRLVRIGQNGQADWPYPVMPPNLGFSSGLYIADIQPSTGYYVAANATNLFFVDVTTNTRVSSVVTTAFGDSSDMAFNPVDDNIYAVRNGSGQVFRVNPTTGAFTDVGTPLPLAGSSGGWGGIFFDSNGTMYAYRSGSSGPAGVVHRIFNVSGTGGPVSWDVLAPNADTAVNLDGARCTRAPAPVPPTVVLRKTTNDVSGGPFSFVLNNTVQTTGSVSSVTAGTAAQVDGDTAQPGAQPFVVQAASIGADLTITESALPTGWALVQASCRNVRTGAIVGSLSGAVYTIPGANVAVGEAFECDFTNARSVAELSISKTNNVTQVVAGSTTTYTIVVTNTGAVQVENAKLRDDWSASPGLDCAAVAPTCAASGTAGTQCPGAGALTSASLAAGVAIPLLPPGGTATFTVNCSVTATGL